jgi:hypothetical protein
MKLGFEFQEVMSGTYTRSGHPSSTGTMRLVARARARDLLQHLRDGLVSLDGTLDMEGVADDVPVSGSIEIRPLTQRVLRYDFSFTGNDGRPYRFVGQKDVKLTALARSMTTLPGTITDAAGHEVARAILRFDLRADLFPFLVSWKPAVG